MSSILSRLSGLLTGARSAETPKDPFADLVTDLRKAVSRGDNVEAVELMNRLNAIFERRWNDIESQKAEAQKAYITGDWRRNEPAFGEGSVSTSHGYSVNFPPEKFVLQIIFDARSGLRAKILNPTGQPMHEEEALPFDVQAMHRVVRG